MTTAARIRKKGKRGSLMRQLMLYFTLTGLIILALGFYFTYAQVMNIVEKQNENLLLQQLRQSDHNISSVLKEAEGLIQLFIQDPNVEEFIRSDIRDQSYKNTVINRNILGSISKFIASHNFINSIYFFTGDKDSGDCGELGRNAKNIFISREGVPAYFESDLYRESRAAYPKTVWKAGYTERFFNPQLTLTDGELFSVAKIVKFGGKTANLVFNIGERYIASIYAADSGEGNVYIIDGAGGVISSGSGGNSGGYSGVIEEIKQSEEKSKGYGSFTSKDESALVQTVYCRIRETDWYLVSEIPLSIYSADVAVIQRILAITFAVSIAALLAASYAWLKKITRPLNVLADRMKDVSSGELGATLTKIPQNELGIVIRRFNEMSLNIAGLVKRNEEIQEEKRRIEIEALQAQINPHFIYNTLNMIKWMAMMAKSKNIVESIISLGNLLRPAFSMNKMCTLREEIEYIRNYLNIMNWRFGNGITLEVGIPEELMDCRAPRFILQPVVENAVIHGIRKPENVLLITIGAFEEAGILHVVVSDTGAGISAADLIKIRECIAGLTGRQCGSDGSIGLYNVHRRICLNYGGEYGLRLESTEGEGTKVSIRLPLLRREESAQS